MMRPVNTETLRRIWKLLMVSSEKKRNRIKYTITPNKNVAHTTEEQRPITDHGKL